MALPTRVLRGHMIDPFEQAHREFDGLMNRMFAGQGGDGNSGQLAPYAVDVREDADHIYVEAELPGFSKKDVDITLENQTLTITAERSAASAWVLFASSRASRRRSPICVGLSCSSVAFIERALPS